MKITRVLNFYRPLVIFVALLGPCEISFAQSVDSLKALLREKSGKDKIGIQIEISRSTSNWDESYDYCNKANNLAYQLGDSLLIVKTSRLKGQILRRHDNLEESVKNLEVALAIAERHKQQEEFTNELILIYNALAISHTLLANYDKALDLHSRALTIKEQMGDKAEISVSLNNIGSSRKTLATILPRGSVVIFSTLTFFFRQ